MNDFLGEVLTIYEGKYTKKTAPFLERPLILKNRE